VAVQRRKAQEAGDAPLREFLINNILPEISPPNRIQTHQKETTDPQSSLNNQGHPFYGQNP
jgi:hypothetical protein